MISSFVEAEMTLKLYGRGESSCVESCRCKSRQAHVGAIGTPMVREEPRVQIGGSLLRTSTVKFLAWRESRRPASPPKCMPTPCRGFKNDCELCNNFPVRGRSIRRGGFSQMRMWIAVMVFV